MREIADAARGGEADRDAVRRRRDAGPGRGQHGARVSRRAAAHRRDPHQARRRRARRRRALGAAGHRRADQVRRRRREDRRPRGVPPRAHGLAHPRHGRRAVADRGRAQVGRSSREAEKLAKKVKSGKGFDLEDFKAQIAQMRKMGGLAGMMDKLPAELARAAQSTNVDEQQDRAHRGHHQFDDAAPSARSPSSSRRRASGGSPPAPASRCRK